MARPKSELTQYILSLPATLSVKDVIAQAKAKGFDTTESNVSRVRAAKKAGPKAKAAKPATSTKKASAPVAAKKKVGRPAKKSSEGPSKSDFIRSMPGASAKQIVAAAKAAGIEFSEKYVSTVRYNAKVAKKSGAKKAKAAPKAAAKPAAAPAVASAPVAKRGPGRPPRAAAKPAATHGSADEKALRSAIAAYAVEHGLAAARAILEDVGSKIRAAV